MRSLLLLKRAFITCSYSSLEKRSLKVHSHPTYLSVLRKGLTKGTVQQCLPK